jgi:hypothetical protein
MIKDKSFKTDEFFNKLNAPDKDSHLLAYILQLSHELGELNKKLDLIIDRENKSIRILVLK